MKNFQEKSLSKINWPTAGAAKRPDAETQATNSDRQMNTFILDLSLFF